MKSSARNDSRQRRPGMSRETRQGRMSEPPLEQGQPEQQSQQGQPQRDRQQQQGRSQRPKEQPQPRRQSGSALQTGQHGEGNYKATRDYDAGVKHHLETHDVEREARDAAPRDEQEKREMEQAEQLGKKKADGMRDPKDDMRRR